jgi:uncharacterized protein YndB with AHSA1/START domain
MLTWIMIAIVVIVAILLMVIATRPSEMQVEREAVIEAPAEAVFELVNDYRQWQHWSPWDHRDPNMERTYSGADAGQGAQYAWRGNKDVGEGRMTIMESRPGEFVRIHLEFIKPFAVTNETAFLLTPEGGRTRVRWSMSGSQNFVAKAMSLFMNMEKMIGGDFEKGLTALDAAAKKARE